MVCCMLSLQEGKHWVLLCWTMEVSGGEERLTSPLRAEVHDLLAPNSLPDTALTLFQCEIWGNRH